MTIRAISKQAFPVAAVLGAPRSRSGLLSSLARAVLATAFSTKSGAPSELRGKAALEKKNSWNTVVRHAEHLDAIRSVALLKSGEMALFSAVDLVLDQREREAFILALRENMGKSGSLSITLPISNFKDRFACFRRVVEVFSQQSTFGLFVNSCYNFDQTSSPVLKEPFSQEKLSRLSQEQYYSCATVEMEANSLTVEQIDTLARHLNRFSNPIGAEFTLIYNV